MSKKMTERLFGRSWLNQQQNPISHLGLGTVAFGRSTGLKYPEPVVRPGDSQLVSLLHTARSLGINLLDTATAYGDSQARLGGLVGDDPYWVIMTKVGERHADGVSTFDFSPAALEADLQQAHSQLRRSILDIVLLHSDGSDEPALVRGPALAALRTAQHAGRIRCVGASLKTVAGIEAAWAAGIELLMLTLNEQDNELAPWIEQSAARGVRVIIKKPLACGVLTAASLGWVAAQPGVSSIVVGTLNSDHLRANAAAVSQRR